VNRSLLAVGLVGCAFAGLRYSAGGANPLPAAGADDSPRVAAPLTHENLAVYFVYGPDAVPDAKVLSLQEALERDLAVVHETGNVNALTVENRSAEYELFIQSGDIVKGGKQDRMAATDMLLPPRSGVVSLPAHCVEQGRWTGRGAESSKQFASSYRCAAGKELRYANASGQQGEVWQKVKDNQDKLNETFKVNVNNDASPTSFQLTLEAPVLQAKVAEYEAALKSAGEGREGVVGVVFVVNGQVTGAEVYGSGALFRKAWPKLLNAAAVEAVAERTDKPTAAPPSAREVGHYLAYGAAADPGGGTPHASIDDPLAVRLELLGRSNRGQRGGEVSANRDLTNEDVGLDSNILAAELNRQVNGDARPRNDLNRPRVAPNPAGAGGGGTADVIQEVADLLDATPARIAPPGVDGNRLSCNRTENNSTLLVESRDPARANAVIHRSYLKK
jgi:hypothetical protein